MKICSAWLIAVCFAFLLASTVTAQSADQPQEIGISTGGFTHFPANRNYLTDNISMFYAAPYFRAGKHEFTAGIIYPLSTNALNYSEEKINPRPGFLAGYKFYVFNIFGQENMFIHYSFEYLRFKRTYDVSTWVHISPVTETDMYINNVIGLGYNLFFDSNERFSFFYILDYVISQKGYRLEYLDHKSNMWSTGYVWNNISTHFGFSFRLTSVHKTVKK
jgi:hypothetical protein